MDEDEKVETLLALGIASEQAIRDALKASFGNVEQAANRLMTSDFGGDGDMSNSFDNRRAGAGSPDSTDSVTVHHGNDEDREIPDLTTEGGPGEKRRRDGISCIETDSRELETFSSSRQDDARHTPMDTDDEDAGAAETDVAALEQRLSLDKDAQDLQLTSKPPSDISYVFFEEPRPNSAKRRILEQNRNLLDCLKVPNEGKWIFPLIHVEQLKASVFGVNWDIPLEYSKSLGICMQCAIRACVLDVNLDEDASLSEFLATVMPEAFNKLFNSNATRGWDVAVLSNVHRMTQILIRLSVLLIPRGRTMILGLLEQCFNTSSEFAVATGARAAFDRPGEADNIPFVEPRHAVGYRQYSWNAANLNEFMNMGGIEALIQFVNSGGLTVPDFKLVLSLFGDLQINFTGPGKEKITPFIQACLAFAQSMNVLDLDGPGFQAMSNALSNLRRIAVDDLLTQVDTLRLDNASKLLDKFDTFSRQMNALGEIHQLCSDVHGAYPLVSDTSPLTEDFMVNFLLEKKVVEAALQQSMHARQYVDKLKLVLEFLARSRDNALTKEHIESIWSAQAGGQHDTIIENVQEMLCQLAWSLSDELMSHLFLCIKRSWSKAAANAQIELVENLLKFLEKLCHHDRAGKVTEKALVLTWRFLLTADKSVSDVFDMALVTHAKLLTLSSLDNAGKQTWIFRYLSHIGQGQHVYICLRLLHEVVEHSPKYTYSSYYNSRHPLTELNSRYDIIGHIFNSAERMLAQARKKAVYLMRPNKIPDVPDVSLEDDDVADDVPQQEDDDKDERMPSVSEGAGPAAPGVASKQSQAGTGADEPATDKASGDAAVNTGPGADQSDDEMQVDEDDLDSDEKALLSSCQAMYRPKKNQPKIWEGTTMLDCLLLHLQVMKDFLVFCNLRLKWHVTAPIWHSLVERCDNMRERVSVMRWFREGSGNPPIFLEGTEAHLLLEALPRLSPDKISEDAADMLKHLFLAVNKRERRLSDYPSATVTGSTTPDQLYGMDTVWTAYAQTHHDAAADVLSGLIKLLQNGRLLHSLVQRLTSDIQRLQQLLQAMHNGSVRIDPDANPDDIRFLPSHIAGKFFKSRKSTRRLLKRSDKNRVDSDSDEEDYDADVEGAPSGSRKAGAADQSQSTSDSRQTRRKRGPKASSVWQMEHYLQFDDAVRQLRRLIQLLVTVVKDSSAQSKCLRACPAHMLAAQGTLFWLRVRKPDGNTLSIYTHSHCPFGLVRHKVARALNIEAEDTKLLRWPTKTAIHLTDDHKLLSSLKIDATTTLEAMVNTAFSSNVQRPFQQSLADLFTPPATVFKPRGMGAVSSVERNLPTLTICRNVDIMDLLFTVAEADMPAFLSQANQQEANKLRQQARALLRQLPTDPATIDRVFRVFWRHNPEHFQVERGEGQAAMLIEDVAEAERMAEQQSSAQPPLAASSESETPYLDALLDRSHRPDAECTSFDELYVLQTLRELLMPAHDKVAALNGPRRGLLACFLEAGGLREVAVELTRRLHRMKEGHVSADDLLLDVIYELGSLVQQILMALVSRVDNSEYTTRQELSDHVKAFALSMRRSPAAESDSDADGSDHADSFDTRRLIVDLIEMLREQVAPSASSDSAAGFLSGTLIKALSPRADKLATLLMDILTCMAFTFPEATREALTLCDQRDLITILLGAPKRQIRVSFLELCRRLLVPHLHVGLANGRGHHEAVLTRTEQTLALIPTMCQMLQRLSSAPLPFWQAAAPGRQRRQSQVLSSRSFQYFELLCELVREASTLHNLFLSTSQSEDEASAASALLQQAEQACHLLAHTLEQVDFAHRANLSLSWLVSQRVPLSNESIPHSVSELIAGHLLLIRTAVQLPGVDKRTFVDQPAGEHGNLIEFLLNVCLSPAAARLLAIEGKSTRLSRRPSTAELLAPSEAMHVGGSHTRPASSASPHEFGADVAPLCRTSTARAAAFELLLALNQDHTGNTASFENELLRTHLHPDAVQAVVCPSGSASKAEERWNIQPEQSCIGFAPFVGLNNAGATCYMNSVIQQLFFNPIVRDVVLKSLDDDGEATLMAKFGQKPDEPAAEAEQSKSEEKATDQTEVVQKHSLLFEMQRIFAHLSNGRLKSYRPECLWRTFRMWGDKVDVRQHQDAVEFFNCFTEQLNEQLHVLERPKIFEAVYGGTTVDQKFCACGHKFTRRDDFSLLNVPVRETLNKGLETYIVGEVLRNSYRCETCDRKVDTLKRTCVDKLPGHLLLQLNRFSFDYNNFRPLKSNDRMSFPLSFDMGSYTAAELKTPDVSTFSTEGEPPARMDSSSDAVDPGSEPDAPFSNPFTRYNLVGVIVHMGMASAGHYYTYVRQRRAPPADGSATTDSAPSQGSSASTAMSRQLSTDEQRKQRAYQASQERLAYLDLSRPCPPLFMDDDIDETTSGGAAKTSEAAPADAAQPAGSAQDAEEGAPAGGRTTYWYKFNDDVVTHEVLTPEEFEHQFFGGKYTAQGELYYHGERDRNWSAYILVYEREDVGRLTAAGADPADIFEHTQRVSEGQFSPVLERGHGNLLVPQSTLKEMSQAPSISELDLPHDTVKDVARQSLRVLHEKHLFSRDTIEFIDHQLAQATPATAAHLSKIAVALLLDVYAHADKDARRAALSLPIHISQLMLRSSQAATDIARHFLETDKLAHILLDCPEPSVQRDVGQAAAATLRHQDYVFKAIDVLKDALATRAMAQAPFPFKKSREFFRLLRSCVSTSPATAQYALASNLHSSLLAVLGVTGTGRTVKPDEIDFLEHLYETLSTLVLHLPQVQIAAEDDQAVEQQPATAPSAAVQESDAPAAMATDADEATPDASTQASPDSNMLAMPDDLRDVLLGSRSLIKHILDRGMELASSAPLLLFVSGLSGRISIEILGTLLPRLATPGREGNNIYSVSLGILLKQDAFHETRRHWAIEQKGLLNNAIAAGDNTRHKYLVVKLFWQLAQASSNVAGNDDIASHRDEWQPVFDALKDELDRLPQLQTTNVDNAPFAVQFSFDDEEAPNASTDPDNTTSDTQTNFQDTKSSPKPVRSDKVRNVGDNLPKTQDGVATPAAAADAGATAGSMQGVSSAPQESNIGYHTSRLRRTPSSQQLFEEMSVPMGHARMPDVVNTPNYIA